MSSHTMSPAGEPGGANSPVSIVAGHLWVAGGHTGGSRCAPKGADKEQSRRWGWGVGQHGMPGTAACRGRHLTHTPGSLSTS